MSWQEFALFLHILAAIVWLGGGVLVEVLTARASGDPQGDAFMGRANAELGGRIFGTASFVALATGVWLVIIGPWEFSELWISLGFLGYLLSAAVGFAVISRTARKLRERMESHGPADPVATQLKRRLTLVGRLDILVLVGVVFVMVTKPS